MDAQSEKSFFWSHLLYSNGLHLLYVNVLDAEIVTRQALTP